MCRPDDLDHKIARLLLGTAAEQARGAELLHEHFRRRVCVRARRYFPGLSAEELADCWQETLIGVVLMGRRRSLQPDRPLVGLLNYIIRCRCTEALRQRLRRNEVPEADADESVPAGDAGVTDLVSDEAFELLWQVIETLPLRQRQVWETYARFGLELTMAELTQATAEAIGQALSETAVRRAFQEGRQTIREFFRRKGYDSDR